MLEADASFPKHSMEKMNKIMELNRETAMRLWVRDFGKRSKAVDFAGREIAKGAYDDRNSNFGWNVDHILPQSQGGKTTDSNLICCHILTNDEKADRFPCFATNGKRFEIVKVQNHYEIKKVDGSNSNKKAEDTGKINFYDSASGIRYFKDLKSIQNKPRFVGSVQIRIRNLTNTAVVDFIENFFDEENISYSLQEDYRSSDTHIVARNYNMSTNTEVNALLDKCVLLNTYLQCYFLPEEYIGSYDIRYRIDHFKEKKEMYLTAQNIRFDDPDTRYLYSAIRLKTVSDKLKNSLFINDLVITNSEAKDKVQLKQGYQYAEYNYIFTNLGKNLNKEVEGN